MYMASNEITQAQVAAWLANPANAQAVGLRNPPRARVNVSANPDRTVKNLLFTDNGKSGALGHDATGQVYYMANIRGRGRFPQFPLTCSKVGIDKENKLTAVITFQLTSDYEINLARAWLAKDANLKPTLEPAKPRPGSTGGSYSPPTQTEVETEDDQVPVKQIPTVVTTTTTTTVPTPASGGFDESQLTMVQKAIRKKAIELGLFANEAEANSKFGEWKNTTMKELA